MVSRERFRRQECRRSRPHSLRRTYENLLRKAGVNDFVRRSLAEWRTEDAQAIYASHDREERDGAGEALVKLVNGAFK
ncbi:MAG: hypothetical protein HYV07_09675 [Deltaproteobacteria bacterium]|nr:hypothetical protein [Deltaproteobacteria bacterium]